jgi:hypothetical protein
MSILNCVDNEYTMNNYHYILIYNDQQWLPMNIQWRHDDSDQWRSYNNQSINYYI